MALSPTFFNLDCYDGIECVNAHFKDQQFAKHVHEGYAIGVIEYGAQRFYSRGENHVSGSGSLVMLNADSVHTGGPASDDGWGYMAMYPTPEMFDGVLSDLTLTRNNAPFFQEPIVNDPRLINQFRLIFSELKRSPSKLNLETLVYAFFMKLTLSQRSISVKDLFKKDSTRVQLVKEYIHAYSHQDISLEELSRVAGLSKYHMVRQFGAVFGITPYQYLIQCRIQKSKLLLSRGNIPSQVALHCGFCDQSHMNIHFKRTFGVTPALYQKQLNLK